MPVRRLIALALIGVIGVSCTGSDKKPQARINFVRDYGKSAPKLTIVGLGPEGIGGSPDDPLQVGYNTVSFQILEPSGKAIEGGQPFVHTAKEDWILPLGPFTATWSPFTGYARTGDTSPRASFAGVYFARIQLSKPGPWATVVTSPDGPKGGVGRTDLYASDSAVAAVGSKAVSVKTPVATTTGELGTVCTRQPPDPMHNISLDDALRNGKPTVVVFSSPGRSASKLGSLVTDEVLLLYRKYGATKANFVHVEEFPPGSSSPSPAFTAWGLTSEPWVFVIDGKGVIRARFEGATTAPMVEKPLKRLL